MKLFPYHIKTASYFKSQAKLWHHFAHSEGNTDLRDLHGNLLKTTYRLEREAEATLYSLIDRAKEALNLKQPITAYQLMETTELNAFVYVLEEEVHIVFSGLLLKLLTEDELLALIAHELGHVLLHQEPDYLITGKILNKLSLSAYPGNPYLETLRLYDLYAELFCDTIALKVCGNINSPISSLVKANIGLENVSASSYVSQAREIFARGNITTESITHPENFIRAYALYINDKQPEQYNDVMRSVLEGNCELESLDVFARKELYDFTKDVLSWLLPDSVVQTSNLLNLFNHYFPGHKPENKRDLPGVGLVPKLGSSSKDYLIYTVLDFVLADDDLKNEMFDKAFVFAKATGTLEHLKRIVRKELLLNDREFDEKFGKYLASV